MRTPASPASTVPCRNAAFTLDMNLAQDQTTHILHEPDGESSAKQRLSMVRRSQCSPSLFFEGTFVVTIVPLRECPFGFCDQKHRRSGFDMPILGLRSLITSEGIAPYGDGIGSCRLHT